MTIKKQSMDMVDYASAMLISEMEIETDPKHDQINASSVWNHNNFFYSDAMFHKNTVFWISFWYMANIEDAEDL